MAATAAQLDGPDTGRRPSCRAGHIRSDRHGEDARSETPRLAARPGSMPAAAAPASDLVLPPLDVRALVRRAAMPVALALVIAAAVIVAGGPLRTFADALGRALQADPRWVGAGAAFELVSFAGYVALLWLVSARATPRLGFCASAQVTLGGAAATRLLPTGGLGGAALTIWAFRRAGLGPRGATRTLLAFLVLLYAVFAASIAAAGGAIALGLAPGHGPLALSAVPAAGATLAILASLALGASRRATEEPVADVPLLASRSARARAALRRTPATLGTAVRDALTLARSGDVRLLGAPAWWSFDAAVLWAMLNAFGTPPSLAVIVLGYFVGQVANTIPIPGAASGGIVGVLLAFGVQPDLAVSSVLAYRAIAIWLPAPIGLAALPALRRTIARWGAEDAPAPAPPPPHRHNPRPLRVGAPPEPAVRVAA